MQENYLPNQNNETSSNKVKLRKFRRKRVKTTRKFVIKENVSQTTTNESIQSQYIELENDLNDLVDLISQEDTENETIEEIRPEPVSNESPVTNELPHYDFQDYDCALDELMELIYPDQGCPDEPLEENASEEAEYPPSDILKLDDLYSLSEKENENEILEESVPSEIMEFENALNHFNQTFEMVKPQLDMLGSSTNIMPHIIEEEISLEKLIIEGKKYLKKREYEKALSCFDLALELDPQYLDAWGAKGDLMIQISHDEISMQNLVSEGRKFMRKREFEKALGYFDRALELNPEYLDAWNAKDDVLKEINRNQNVMILT